MTSDLATLSFAAVTVGFLHCICGPDHYIPFVAMSRVGVWSLRKTLLVTLICGVGHVAGSALLGFIGVALGLIVFQLESAEEVRGDMAGWLLFTFGVAYLVGGLFYAVRSRAKEEAGQDAALESAGSKFTRLGVSASFVPWILFLLFAFGPCEPLIPLLIYPAAKASVWSVVWVTTLFALTTLLTMLTLVALMYHGSSLIRVRPSDRYGHALAGLAVTLCGVAILVGL